MTKKDVEKIRYIKVPSTNVEETIFLRENEIITKIFVESFLSTVNQLVINLDNFSISFNASVSNFQPFVYEITVKTNKAVFKSANEYFILLEITTLEEECE